MSSPAMPKEQRTAYQRWELDSFDAPKEAPLGGAPKVSIPPEGKVPLGDKGVHPPLVRVMMVFPWPETFCLLPTCPT